MAYTTEITLPDNAPDQSGHWSKHASDPNDSVVMERRAHILAAAWRPPVADRIDFIRYRIAGRSVLDVGCVAHDDARMQSAEWLHRRVADVADSCIGVDVLDDGIASMQAKGFNAISHDLNDGAGPLKEMGPFQAIVAGELIEHVANLDMLFSTAAELLSADGELIITTPNPYAPARVRAGQRGEIWENVDHVMYAFPSGVAELASRHGLVLAEARTTKLAAPPATSPIRWLKRSIKQSHWHRRGFATTTGAVRPVVLDRRDRFDRVRTRVLDRISSNHNFVGETFIYVIQRDTLP